jgi:hypothetical protein
MMPMGTAIPTMKQGQLTLDEQKRRVGAESPMSSAAALRILRGVLI